MPDSDVQKLCACGCETPLTKPVNKNWPKRFQKYHYVRTRKVPKEQRMERNRQHAARWYKENAARRKEYQEQNKESITAKYKVYYQQNRAEILRKKRLDDKKNAERNKTRDRAYKRAHRALQNLHRDRHIARLHNAQGFHTLQQWVARVAFFGWRCRYCGKALTLKTLTKDHLIPLVRGGANWASNLAPACRSCNCSKRQQTFKEYLAWRKNI